jgi:hypothetical protein
MAHQRAVSVRCWGYFAFSFGSRHQCGCCGARKALMRKTYDEAGWESVMRLNRGTMGLCPFGLVAFIAALSAALLLTNSEARATMPPLTNKPEITSLAACRAWAVQQSTEAIQMWGIQEDGTRSRPVAIDRLTMSCMGQESPEIVGFGSSIGFDQDYCGKHRTFKICAKP